MMLKITCIEPIVGTVNTMILLVVPFSADADGLKSMAKERARRSLEMSLIKAASSLNRESNLEVSRRIHDEFDNGEYYYTFHGTGLHVPPNKRFQPSPKFLTWHNENIFRGWTWGVDNSHGTSRSTCRNGMVNRAGQTWAFSSVFQDLMRTGLIRKQEHLKHLV